MSVSEKISGYMERASWIRKMFEQGLELKSKLGADKVFDFSLGNPNLEPPEQVRQAGDGRNSGPTPRKTCLHAQRRLERDPGSCSRFLKQGARGKIMPGNIS